MVILLWLAVTAFSRLGDNFRWLAWASTGTCLLFNLVFLALGGIANLQQGGALRVALLLFVGITVILSGLFAYLRGEPIRSLKEMT